MDNQKKLNCPACGKPFTIEADAAKPGSVVQCTHCSKKLRLPGGDGPAAPSSDASTKTEQMSPQQILLTQMEQASKPAAHASGKRPVHAAAGSKGPQKGKPSARRPTGGEGEALVTGYALPPAKKNAALLIWGIVAVLAAAGVLVAMLIRAKSMPQDGRLQDGALVAEERPARNLTPPSPEAVRRQSAAERQRQPAAERVRAEPEAAKDATHERLTFKPQGPTMRLDERPGRLFQLIEVTNESDRHLASGRGKVAILVGGKPHETMDFFILDVGPRQTRMILSDSEDPDSLEEIQYHPSYTNIVHADNPVFNLTYKLKPLIYDGESRGTALVEITNNSSRPTVKTRLSLVLLRENGDFCGYEERVVAPLKAGETRVEEMRWSRWPNHMVSRGVVQVEGLMEREAAEISGE